MKTKLLISLFIGAALVGGTYRVSSSAQKQRELKQLLERQRGTAMWYVTDAKIKGQTKAFLPTRIIDYLSPNSVGSALANNHQPVVAQVLGKKSFLFDGEWIGIITWYKFKILDNLSARPVVPCQACSQPNPPEEMLPLSTGEILVPKTGGEVEIDGVRLIERDRYLPEFSESERLLLFLSPTQSPSVNLLLGVGTFRLSEEGVMIPLFKEDPQPLIREVAARYGNSLQEMRADLRGRLRQ